MPCFAKPRLATLAAALALSQLALPATAGTVVGNASATVDEARATIDAFAIAIDADRDGYITPTELDAASRTIHAAMDADGDGRMTPAEMLGWEGGMADLAAFRGRTQAYDAAMSIVFDLLDRDRDGVLTADEYVSGMAAAASLADRDGDGRLSMDEFRDDFLVTTALRHGLNG